jgi:hypothetical protein
MANARFLLQIAMRWDFPYTASVSCFVPCHAFYKADVAPSEIPELVLRNCIKFVSHFL